MSNAAVPDLEGVETQRGSLHVFAHRDFVLFFTAASISNAGSWMQLVAVQALMYKLTEQGTWLGISTVATLVPAVVLTPYAGVLADRISRQFMLKVTQSVQMVAAMAMWAMYVSGSITPWWIVAFGVVNGASTGFQTAAWQSFVPLLVPPQEILHAVRLNSTQYTVARALGPALGGLVVTQWGIGVAIACNAVTYLLVIAVLFAVKPRLNPMLARIEGVWAGLVDGARYTWSHRPLRLAVILAFVVSIFGQSLQYVAAAVAEQVFGRSAESNAGLLTALGIGSLLTAGTSAVYGGRIKRSRQALTGVALYVTATGLLALTGTFPVGMVAYFLAGCGHLSLAVALNTMIQGAVPDEYRGRVTSFYLLGILGGIPVGSQLLGSLGDLIGFRPALGLYSGAFVVVGACLFGSGWWRLLDGPSTLTGVASNV